MKSSKRKNGKLIYEFLPAALEIEESPPSPLGKTVVCIIVSIIIFFLTWACIAKVDEVAVTRGNIIYESGTKVVQPISGGIVTSIHVSEGQLVNKGDILVQLDSAEFLEQLDFISSSIHLLNFENEMINNILSDKTIDDLKTYTSSSKDEKDLINFYITKSNNYFLSVKSMKSQINQVNAELSIEKLNMKTLIDSLDTANFEYKDAYKVYSSIGPEEQTVNEYRGIVEQLTEQQNDQEILLKEGKITQVDYNKTKSELTYANSMYNAYKVKADAEKKLSKATYDNANRQLKSLNKQILTQKLKIEQIENKITQLNIDLNYNKSVQKNELNNKQIQNNRSIYDLLSQKRNIENSIKNNTLTAPINGEIKDVWINTIGGVVTSAQPLLTIVPSDDIILAEVVVTNKDIGYIKKNQEVSIKMDTFSFQKYGVIDGKVTYISPDATKDESGALLYKIHISLDKNQLVVDGLTAKISPGMTLTAEIKTGKKRIIDFFLEPIIKELDESIKVR
ncbi:MAG: HlyD family efflux transporter periplasmic adaptor subunit [Parabacteroides sp.]|nr:HlyD family efflux transporter periplasmic adaptor subunit [Parabacteroides sp.]